MSDAVTFNTTFVDRECKKCGHVGQPSRNDETHEIHGYKLYCEICGAFFGWGGKEHKIKNANNERVKSTMWTPKRLGRGKCQLCNREKDFVEACGEKLESHHLVPVSEGGEDEPYNILVVCTPCHRTIHHNMTYYSHMKAFYTYWAASRGLRERSGEVQHALV